MPGESSNNFGYPAGFAPGYNPQHLASTQELRFSCVATGHKQLWQLFPGFGLAAAVGTNTLAGPIGPIGPTIIPGAYSEVRFTKLAQDRVGTCACIMFGPSAFDPFGASFYNILSDSGFNSGGFQLSWGASAGGIFINAPNGGPPYGWQPASNIIIPLREPIFLAACYQESGPACFVMRNLATGELFAQPSSANGGTLNTTASSSYWFIGGVTFGVSGGDEHYNCAMFSGDYLGLPALVKWSEDPWDFWYPRQINTRKRKGAAFIVQVLRPDADDSISDWTNQASGTTAIFNSIDETSASDTDYIQSPAPPNASVARFRMSNPTAGKTLVDPVKVSYRFKKTNSADQQLVVSLKQGASVPLIWGDHGGQISLSNSDRDATSNSASLWSSVRASQPHTTGKFYFEVEYLGNAGSNYFAAGVMDDFSGPLALDSYTPAYCGATRDDGYQFVNGFTVLNNDGFGTVAVGDRVGVAVDLDNKEEYFSRNGIWMSGSNPVTRTKPRFTWGAPVGSNIYPCAMLFFTGARLHGSTANLIYGPPSGYSAWDVGLTLIKSWTHTGAGLTETFQTVEQTLSGGELASITDFNNLYIEFQASPP